MQCRATDACIRKAIVYYVSERESKELSFDVCKNTPTLIGYYGNVPWTIAKIMSVL